jgi:hypothetical protein
MEHSFNVQFAQKYGIEEAIIVHNFYFWLRKNIANEKHLHNGRYWTYNSNNAFTKLFPYINKTKIFRVLKHLEECDIILKDNFNTNVWDKTLWYSFSDHGLYELYAFGYDVTDFGKMNHRDNQSETTIPYSKQTDSITDNKEKEDNKLSSQKKESTWRDDFQLFLAEVNKAKGILLVDATFRDKQERYYPNIDYVLSLEKMVDDYWGTEEAWNKRKKQKKNNEGIDMVATLKKAFSQSCNRVYKRRESTPRQADFFKGFTPQKISDRANDYLHTLKVDIKFEQDGVKYLKDDTFISEGKRYYRNKFGSLIEVPIGLVARPNENWEYNKNSMVWVQDERTMTTDDFMF